MVGDSQRVEAMAHGVRDQVRDAPQPVEQAELGVRVEVRESRWIDRARQLVALPSLTSLGYR